MSKTVREAQQFGERCEGARDDDVERRSGDALYPLRLNAHAVGKTKSTDGFGEEGSATGSRLDERHLHIADQGQYDPGQPGPRSKV